MDTAKPTSPDIVTEGNPVLRAHAKPVPKSMFGTEELAALIAKMSRALREEPHGVAIAAPQIGESWRIFVVRGYVLQRIRRSDPGADTFADIAFINPVFLRQSKKKEIIEGEGCLSVPNIYGNIERSARAAVEAQDTTGKKFERGGSGLIAEIFEHEVDHLNGILFTDKATNIHEGKDDKK